MSKDQEALVIDVGGETNETPRLNYKNYGNIIFYVLNILFTYGIGVAGWTGTPTNEELSLKYQTLITPKSSAFSIWAVIFTFQGVFAILQLVPSYRGRPMVQEGVSFWHMIFCVMQIGWTFAFAYEVIPLSLVFMLLLWISLMALIISQYYVKLDPSTSSCSKEGLNEFWFLRFPFQIHAGWITAASALNVSVVAVDAGSAPATQLAVGIICLAALHAISVWHLFGYKRPNYTIPCVLIWANGWIYGELQEPKQLILDTFDQSVISGVAYAAFTVSMVIIIQVVLRLAFLIYNYALGKSYLQEKVEEEEEDEV
eukprot:CAMPEP_0203684524 /NCGR_PEP_ID=MMETSP0090-20130426/48080_1 /ASSEMBLY_ACC=CAM_ASM_001088 /TAXON_ID=426623 /ORGANISM="Chaetoceros affinis, Strain CCMP159" /LENGTH=312 /DNA_ID=CAMNT_0050553699 /DNA_START=142 /DNA_END=1080 /DNA_ORIENTATION=-